MALTIEQVFNSRPNPLPPANEWGADVTLTIAQEDGRVGYIQGTGMVIQVIGRLPDLALEGDFVFNDRDRFRGNADRVGVRLSAVNPNMCRAFITLLTWGGGYQCDLALPLSAAATGLMYQGFGNTIGFGTGQALHLLTLNNARLIPVLN